MKNLAELPRFFKDLTLFLGYIYGIPLYLVVIVSARHKRQATPPKNSKTRRDLAEQSRISSRIGQNLQTYLATNLKSRMAFYEQLPCEQNGQNFEQNRAEFANIPSDQF